MGRIVCKFGGTSLCCATQLRAVSDIVRADPRRNIIVASAPGKRAPKDDKITDLLISGQICAAKNRLQQMADALGAPMTVDLPCGADADFTASRGEYYCARMLAHVLGFAFVDAALLIRFDNSGRPDPVQTAECIRRNLTPDIPAVVPGFYGACADGGIRTLPRGGSDTTGALIAAALQAECYENFTDVPGLMDCDPRLIPDAQSIPCASWDEVRLLTRCGATVLHEDALAPVQQAGIPIRLRSTFDPAHPGTLIGSRAGDRPMIAVLPQGADTRCAVAGPMPESFLPALIRLYPALRPDLTHCGVTFSLPLPPKEAAQLIRRLLKA